MTTPVLRLIAFLLLVAPAASQEVGEVLARARAYAGTEAALEGLRSVRYSGTLETETDADRRISVPIEIRFERPFRQRITVTAPRAVEVTALDDYEAWMQVEDPTRPGAWRLSLLGPDQVRRLRANTWENLSFFRGLESRGGRVEDLGLSEVDGLRVRKVAFHHGGGIVFTRCFDLSTGRLVLTQTDQGGTIREEGEIVAGGIRFPSRIVTTHRNPDGSTRKVTITLSEIEVNGPTDPSLFRVPQLHGR